MRHKLIFVQKKVIGLLCVSMFVPMVANAQSLEQAVTYSLDTHPNIGAAYTNLKILETKVEQAEAGYFPTIDLTGGIGFEYTDSPGTRTLNADAKTLRRTELGLNLTYDLFDGYHTSSEVSRTSSDATAEQWRVYSEAEDLALEVSKVYVNLIKNEQLMGLSEKNYAYYQQKYDQIKLRTDAGLSSSADFSKISGLLANAQSNLTAFKNNYLDSKAIFYRIVGQRPGDLIVPYPDSSLLSKNKNDGLKVALKNNPVIKAVANDIDAAQYQYKSAESTYYPKVSFVVEANFGDNLDGVDTSVFANSGNSNEVLAMVRFSYNIFSGGRNKASAKEAAYYVNEAKDLNRVAHRQVEEGFMLSWNAFEQLNIQKKYIKMHVIAAKKTQLDNQQQFRIGQRSLFDLLATENELYQSRIDFVSAEMAEITAQYRVLHAMGLLIQSLKVMRPASW